MLQSGIHGWGLIARAEMKQDSMVVEYRGDLLRPKMSDDRQKLYNRIGKDCYLFNVNDDVVIDATMTGAVGRFTVSSRDHLWLLLGDVCAFMQVFLCLLAWLRVTLQGLQTGLKILCRVQLLSGNSIVYDVAAVLGW